MEPHVINIEVKYGKIISIYIWPKNVTDIIEVSEQKGFPTFQLIEGRSYNYELSDADYYISGDSQIITHNPSHSGVSSGIIMTGNYVGTFTADIKSKLNNDNVGHFRIAIRSIKIGYEEDYRKMMEDITEFCTELLMQQSSPVTQNYTINPDTEPQILYERFAFVKSLVESESFDDAINQIESHPVTKWENIEEEQSIDKVQRLGSNELRQFAVSRRRIGFQHGHPLFCKLKTVPEKINVQSRHDTTDVAENRFVKFALNSFLGFCQSILKNIYAKDELKREAEEVCQTLFQYLSHPLFRRLGNLSTIPMGNPILQKRAGYREVLQKWLMFDMAAKLSWEGGEDVYSAGQKNMARLYEYWLFFKLLKEFSRKFHIQHVDKNKLLVKTDGNLGLRLKEGRMQVMHGTYVLKGRKLNLAFAYNRTFKYTNEYKQAGSWSQQMRPDYTLSIWPGDIEDPNVAENQDLITHIHFDAKYRIENLLNEFKKGNEQDLTIIKHEEEQGTYKRGDLLKMHAYKDAIKRSAGAYVLYPGTDNPEPFLNFHEIIPGLGAFAISPRNNSLSYFLKFIDDVIENFLNRTSQRERMQYHRFKDLQDILPPVFAELPEPYVSEQSLPNETMVLIGYTRSENISWVEENLFYPARIGINTRGSIILNKEVINVTYLLSYNSKSQKLYKIDVTKGIKIVTKEELLKKYGYKKPRHDNYMLFHLKEAENEFSGFNYDIKALNEKAYNKKTLFVKSLVDLIKKRIK